MRRNEKKNLFYSLLLAGFLLLFLISYFIYMVPSLYVDHLMDENLTSIRKQHRTYVETGSYENIRVKNPTACFSIRIPEQDDTIFVTGKSFSLKITLTDPNFQETFYKYQSLLFDMWEESSVPDPDSLPDIDEFFAEWKTLFQNAIPDTGSLPVEIQSLQIKDPDTEYKNEYFRYHSISDRLVIWEAGVEDTNNSYTNYIAIEKLDDALVISLLPTITPDIKEIRPVVLQSLPALAAVILLLVLLFSLIYSKGIIAPANRLIIKSYEELEMKNKALAKENERQEIFLRASSHQLKTPVSAALLLVDGMIAKVGKYCDTGLYLPKVKEQLLHIRKITDDILSLNHLKDQLQTQELDLNSLLDSRLSICQAAITDKQLTIARISNAGGKIFTDERIATLLLDNLLSNAINYTPSGQKVEIRTSPGMVQIQNYGIRIPDDLLPHIFDPFVSGNHGAGGHGLGLYIAAYYAPLVNAALSVINDGESVLAILSFSPEQP